MNEGGPFMIDLANDDDKIVPAASNEALVHALPVERKRNQRRSSRSKRKTVPKKRTLKCIACSYDHDAEAVHPILQIPICGACNLACKQRDLRILDQNESSCVMCGRGDDNELLMCDSCVYAYCSLCIQRNFGSEELEDVRVAEIWQCYLCSHAPQLQAIQIDKNTIFYSLDAAYAAVHPPATMIDPLIENEFYTSLSEGEMLFLSLFSSDIADKQQKTYAQFQITTYLSASDILSKIFRLSKKIRFFFHHHTSLLLCGLFQTIYGQENLCRLHPHQMISLQKLHTIENHSIEFGSLRGGIFADEPGLGKTVTILALVTSTAGVIPHKPPLFWNEEVIETSWNHLYSQHEPLIAPILNKLRKLDLMNLSKNDKDFEDFKSKLRKGSYSLKEVQVASKLALLLNR
jgi:hypothetical protein